MPFARTVHRFFGVPYALAALALLCGAGCGGSNPAAPTPPSGTVSLIGTWRGSASDSSGPGQMTWQITQSDTSFSGTATLTDPDTGTTGTGTVSGTLSGSSIHFSITIQPGGFSSPFGSCSASASGDAQASSSTISGTYTGSNSCSGEITSGQLSLGKQ